MAADPRGFERSFVLHDKPCIGVFGPGYVGKTRFCTTAGIWSAARGKVPGWIILDRKTRPTVEFICNEMGIEPPLMSKSVYITPADALKLANNDDEETTKKAYTAAFNKVTDDISALAALDHVEPIIIDSGTELWEWIGYARLGRREGVKSRYWGPSKRDWKDLFEAIKHKTVLVTLWARAEYKDDKATNRTLADGPPSLNYTTTSLVRLRKDERKTDPDEKFLLDVDESIDNAALDSSTGLLTGEGITFENLMSLLRPEE